MEYWDERLLSNNQSIINAELTLFWQMPNACTTGLVLRSLGKQASCRWHFKEKNWTVEKLDAAECWG